MDNPNQPTEPTAEEKFAPKLPQQIIDQMAAVNAVMGIPENQPDGEGGEGAGEDAGEDAGEGTGDDRAAPPELQFQDGQAPQPEDTWEQRARSTHGRLEQALATNQQMSRRVHELEEQINLLKLRGAEAPQQPPPPAAKPKLINEKEVEEYGDEFFDVVGRRAREEFVPEVETLKQRIARLESGQQAVGKVVETTQKRGLYDTLYEVVPQWKQINHSPAFIQWLGNLDPYSGRPRQELLSDAFTRHDSNRVVNFFQGFLSEVTGNPQTSQARTPSAPPPANGSGSGRPSLEDFVAPGRARSVPQAMSPEKPVYTQAWIAKFSDDKRKGLWRGREAEAEQIERDIYQAQHEGRYQP
jgi:cell division protein FtsB